jgi:membrane-bound lytic murein transglycosylase F
MTREHRIWIGLLSLALLLVFALRAIPDLGVDPLDVTVTDPVERDFDRITESGVIRLITRYNSQTYFLQDGVERGFEFEFFSAFAREHGLRVEVVVPQPDEQPIDVLNRGDGDVIAANYTVTEERQRHIAFSHPYNLVTEILVVREDSLERYSELDSLRGLTIHVRKNSSYYTSLLALENEGVEVNIELVPESVETQALLAMVASGEITATIADDNLFEASTIFIKGIAAGPSISETKPIAWGIRSNAPMLEAKMNEFISTHFKVQEEAEGELRRSELINVLRARYYENPRAVLFNRHQVRKKLSAGSLSPYDSLAQRVAADHGLDWRLIIAIAAQESRFDPDAVSWKGAVGLMQIMPAYSDVESDTMLFDVESNMREGARILKSHLSHFAYLDSLNQLRFSLASYNAGIGHMADARRLAIDLNRNPNDWEGVQDAFLRLMERTYHRNATYGFVRGIETVNYVNTVLNRYKNYRLLTERRASAP